MESHERMNGVSLYVTLHFRLASWIDICTGKFLLFFPLSLPPGAVPIESEAEYPEDFTQALGLSMALTAMLDIAVG